MVQSTNIHPRFHVVSGQTVYETIFRDTQSVVDLVEMAYREHNAGRTINPDSYFLRFPDRPQDRIIALPAHLDGAGPYKASGIKWISSFPENIKRGLPRASAVLILNDNDSGYPLACLEASVISAARTAASAVLGALWLNGHQRRANRIGLIGTGLIGRYIIEFLLATGWTSGSLQLHDLDTASAEAFRSRFSAAFPQGVQIKEDPIDLTHDCDLVIFATTASAPYINDRTALRHNPLVLHISLRDLDPDIVLEAHNIVDDIEHCLKASTSTHLAAQKAGHHDFIVHTLPQILCGASPPDRSKPIIFSPFGMGILDIAVGIHVLNSAIRCGKAIAIDNFFYDLIRA